MRLEYNNVFYEGSWDDDKDFTFQTDMTLSEIEEIFIPGIQPTTITLYDGEQMIVRYYNKGLTSVKISSHTPRIITLSFDLTKILPDAEIILQNKITAMQSDIETLTFWMNQLKQANMFELRQNVISLQESVADQLETIQTLSELCTEFSRNISTINTHLENLEESIQALEGRVAILESTNEPEPAPEEPESQEEPSEEEGE